MKYTAKVIAISIVYIDNNTCYPADPIPTSDEKLLDAFQEKPKYTFCELFSNLGTVTARTKTDLWNRAGNLAFENGVRTDYFMHMVKIN